MSLRLDAVEGLGEVVPGTDLGAMIVEHADLADGDVVVVTSKVVSKALGLATTQDRDAVVAAATVRVVAERGPTRIVRTVQGLTMAAAGVDASNTEPGTVIPLPLDPDAEARAIRARVRTLSGRTVAVVVSDTAGRAWRTGQTDIAIGCAGLVPVESFAGRTDTHGNPLAVTAPAVADEVAGAAELASGKLGGRPVVVVRGVSAHLLTEEDGPGAVALQRPDGEDLFGLGARDAVVAAVAAVRGDADPVGFPVDPTVTLEHVVALADTGDLDVEVDGSTVRLTAPGTWPLMVELGRLVERIGVLAVAHELDVDIAVVGRSPDA